MKPLSYYLDQMNELLDHLIETAKALRDLSLQVVSEEELTAHQKRQKELLVKIEDVDQTLEAHFWNQIDDEQHSRFHKKLHTFQTLNQEFIQNLKESHGLIQFELSHLHAEEENEQFASQLNKFTPPPKSNQTVKPKKSKKS